MKKPIVVAMPRYSRAAEILYHMVALREQTNHRLKRITMLGDYVRIKLSSLHHLPNQRLLFVVNPVHFYKYLSDTAGLGFWVTEDAERLRINAAVTEPDKAVADRQIRTDRVYMAQHAEDITSDIERYVRAYDDFPKVTTVDVTTFTDLDIKHTIQSFLDLIKEAY